ncbi:MAG: hypothetical protein IPK79_05425 [Vampirovibrionales bacterium]|nr:hypothetical protein [Vampirovibrionales bacterium]
MALPGAAAPQSFWRLLARSFQLYGQWGARFTLPVLAPTAYKLGGLLYCALMPFYVLEAALPLTQNGQTLSAMALVLASPLPGLALFCVGVWRYLALMASLSTNAAQVLANAPPDFKAASRAIDARARAYSRLLGILLGGIWLPALGIYLVTLALSVWMPSVLLRVVLLLSGMGLALAALGAATVFYIACSTAFQVAALEPHHLRARDTLRRCLTLARGQMGRLTLAMTAWTLVTSLLAPAIICALSDVTGLTRALLPASALFVTRMLDAYSPAQLAQWGASASLGALYDWLYGLMDASRSDIARGGVHLTLGLAVTLLSLPWGTFLFTLLYQDLRLRHELTQKTSDALAPQETPAS